MAVSFKSFSSNTADKLFHTVVRRRLPFNVTIVLKSFQTHRTLPLIELEAGNTGKCRNFIHRTILTGIRFFREEIPVKADTSGPLLKFVSFNPILHSVDELVHLGRIISVSLLFSLT
ncbi:hypothetical protein AVEN_120984-1 [Araneus ventricosus]|uniref:Uncharacterized protein n=1 Tax=Araneus ventricosus TaxID=182803 RepID=A0A4Y2L8W3_ARAVE|nr:hypothetical protein AVEN_120984-1 [Araneus ventricosus]